MKVLITGGNGFIGSNLYNYLLLNNYEVVVAVRFKTFDLLLDNNNYVEVDYNNSNDLIDICKNVNYIIHTAGPNSSYCSENPISSINQRVEITQNLLNAAVLNNVEKFIYLSSVHVYSDNLTGFFSETNPTININPYAISHLNTENTILKFHNLNKLECIILRLSNVFGTPNNIHFSNWDLFFLDICKQIATTEKLSLKSDGSQYRDFISLNSFFFTIQKLLKNSYNFELPILNLANGHSYSINEIVNKVEFIYKEITNKNLQINRFKPEVNNILNKNEFSINKLKNYGLYKNQNTDIEIKNMLIYFLNNFKKTS